ncbi:MAG: molecular chaperone DnaK [Saprospiraceae bacterium]
MAKFAINLKKGTIAKDSDVIVGIDLGTTNSLVAYIKDGESVAVKDENGKNTLVPSVVHFKADGSTLVGEEAKQKLVTEPENTIYSVKRLMGKSFNDVESVEQYFGYKIINEDEDKLVKVRVGDKFYTPIELSSFILESLKKRIEKVLDATVRKAVITVPAYFNDAQRQATRDAGKLAGLDVLRIVNEPTAASLAYGIGLKADETKTIAVYDLGGGTFDISILQIDNGIFEVLSTNGDTFLGGDDFDRAIIDYWVDTYNIDKELLSTDKNFSQKVRLLAEEAKKVLSSTDTFKSEINGLNIEITLEKFNELVQPLVNRTIKACKNALKDAEINVPEIDSVVMVGGSTRIPLVKSSVATFFGKEVNDSLNPDEVVAKGAAIQADVLAGNNKNLLLIDITPLSLGIETVGGLMDTIIPRNSKVPNRSARQYTTSVDGQTKLKVAVFQGERDLVTHNRKLGEFILTGIPPMPMGLPKIEIQFILDADGILKVKAKELRSGVEQTVEMRSQYGLSEEEMAEMLIDSIQNAQSDMAKRAVLEAKNEANNIIRSAEKFLEQNGRLLTEEEIATTQSLTTALKKSVEGEDKDVINQAMDDLNQFTSPLAHRAMDVNIKEAMSGRKV